MEISDIKIAIGAVVTIIMILTTSAYLASAISETMVIGLASTSIAAIAGLAGFEMGKKVTE